MIIQFELSAESKSIPTPISIEPMAKLPEDTISITLAGFCFSLRTAHSLSTS